MFDLYWKNNKFKDKVALQKEARKVEIVSLQKLSMKAHDQR
jgi:hypothetical protein